MSSVNKVILIGNVGADPEVRYLDRGVAIANFNLATTERGYVMQNGTQVLRVLFLQQQLLQKFLEVTDTVFSSFLCFVLHSLLSQQFLAGTTTQKNVLNILQREKWDQLRFTAGSIFLQ